MAKNDNMIPEGDSTSSGLSSFLLNTISKELTECFDTSIDYKIRIKNLSLLLNKILDQFAAENNANLFVGNVGHREYPERYPMEKHLQLFDLINPRHYLNLPHAS